MADEQSIQLLSSKIVSKFFADKCLAQDVNRSLSVLTSVIGEYLDPVLKEDRCA